MTKILKHFFYSAKTKFIYSIKASHIGVPMLKVKSQKWFLRNSGHQCAFLPRCERIKRFRNQKQMHIVICKMYQETIIFLIQNIKKC